MSRDRFIADSAGGGMVPVARRYEPDTKDAAELLARLERGPFSFLLESAVGMERWARYTWIGTEPREAWRYHMGKVERWTPREGWREAGAAPDPLGHLSRLMREYQGPPPGPGARFRGGAAGFAGYDVVRSLERLPGGPPPDTPFPDALFMIADALVELDNVDGTASVIVNAQVPERASAAERSGLYDAASARIDEWIARLATPVPLIPIPGGAPPEPCPARPATPDRAFLADVSRLKEHIARGDIFQAVLSRRLEVEGGVDPLLLYRCLRTLNPAPYLFYLRLGEQAIVGSSPEMLVRVHDGEVTVRPIAGTRPRGASPEADAALASELAADPKERAEHLMLVDLGRNDVGRVARYGSVRVADLMSVERYAEVQHLVSEVRGTLADGRDAVDALKACFPAGTVTGAPKVRAMELLDALEPVRRGPYAGAVGYLGWGARNLDSAIAIRTCVVLPDRVLVQAGAGIVADSDPVRELEETEHKARAALRAVALARRSTQDR